MNAWQNTWSLVSWELILGTKSARAQARKFRKALARYGTGRRPWGNLRRGAWLLLGSKERIEQAVAACLPEEAEVRIVPVTDKQIEKSTNLWGKRRQVTA